MGIVKETSIALRRPMSGDGPAVGVVPVSAQADALALAEIQIATRIDNRRRHGRLVNDNDVGRQNAGTHGRHNDLWHDDLLRNLHLQGFCYKWR